MANKTEDKDRELLLETYKLYMARYNAIFPMVYTDLKFYAGLLFAIIGGTAYFAHMTEPDVNEMSKTLGISGGGILISLGIVILGLSYLGLSAVRSSWEAWARSITTLAKLESLLGLGALQRDRNWGIGIAGQVLWKEEPIVFPKHAIVEGTYCSSDQFIQAAKREGYLKIAKWLFIVTGTVGIYVVFRGLIVAKLLVL